MGGDTRAIPLAHRPNPQGRVLVICGPTGTGKTTLGIELAHRLGGEIIGMDSRQIYRGFRIGTAQASARELAAAPHHLVDALDPRENISAGRWAVLARTLIEGLWDQDTWPILVGGTGLYLSALRDGLIEHLDIPPALREELGRRMQLEGPESLVNELTTRDPAVVGRIELRNPVRVMRALEVFLATGRSITWWWDNGRKDGLVAKWHLFAPKVERELLYPLLDARVDRMILDGLANETRLLMESYDTTCRAFDTLGYREMERHLHGEIDLETCTAQIKQHTRQYAKRQETWFRRVPGLQWIPSTPGSDLNKMTDFIITQLSERTEHGS